MKISGFTFVRNAVVFSYPMLESLNSLLPFCDELIIAAGKSDDNTLQVLESINEPKIRIIETEWDMDLKKDALIYSQQTNIALAECSGDWCFYLQADEVLHEKDFQITLDSIHSADKNPKVDALLFKYRHFYGSYDYTGVGRQWYRREIRAFRNTGNIISYGDAQGFRKKTNSGLKKMTAVQIDSEVFHYGWVRPPKAQFKKLNVAANFYSGEGKTRLETIEDAGFDYNTAFELKKFQGTHPGVMKNKINIDKEWTQFFDPKKLRKKPLRIKITDGIEKATGWRIGEYKDFIEL